MLIDPEPSNTGIPEVEVINSDIAKVTRLVMLQAELISDLTRRIEVLEQALENGYRKL